MDKKVEPLVSVIVPVYKVEQYVETCIQSILNQTYQKLEIIIVNDGTPDQSMKIAEKVAKDDKRTIFINKENGGLSSARNAGLEVAQGEFVFFVDSDDKIHSKTIEILISEMKDDVDISVITFKKIISLKENEDIIEKAEFKYISGLDALKLYLDDNTAYWIVSWGKLYRKSLFENIRFPLGKIHEDEYTTYQLIYEARKVAYSNLKIYYYLQRSDSIMGSIDLSKRMHYMEALILRNKFLKKKKLSEMYKQDVGRSSYLLYKYRDIIRDENLDNDILQKKLKNLYLKWVKVNFLTLNWKEKIACIMNCVLRRW